VLRSRRLAKIGGLCTLLTTAWFLVWTSAGVINTNVLATLGLLGGFFVTAATASAAFIPHHDLDRLPGVIPAGLRARVRATAAPACAR
jgi:hypothetical protein